MFQSTHLHEVWQKQQQQMQIKQSFQSTHLHEVWHNRRFTQASTWRFQSTHLHEVWQLSFHDNIWSVTFQSTHLHEVWLNAWVKTSVSERFQSTHLHEVWHWLAIIFNCKDCFNPHTYMRCDKGDRTMEARNIVSIHTPTWGVTSITCQNTWQKRFQSTHLHEVWHWYRFYGSYVNVSIHTPTWGVTLNSRRFCPTRFSFNPHTYMRCDLKVGQFPI